MIWSLFAEQTAGAPDAASGITATISTTLAVAISVYGTSKQGIERIKALFDFWHTCKDHLPTQALAGLQGESASLYRLERESQKAVARDQRAKKAARFELRHFYRTHRIALAEELPETTFLAFLESHLGDHLPASDVEKAAKEFLLRFRPIVDAKAEEEKRTRASFFTQAKTASTEREIAAIRNRIQALQKHAESLPSMEREIDALQRQLEDLESKRTLLTSLSERSSHK